MTHKNMAATADGLEARGVATLRYNFPTWKSGSKRPDNPPVAHAAIRAAVADAAKLAGDLPLFAGGRSFGARMTSQAQSLEPLANVKGLVFFAFPLHAPGKPGVERAEHLKAIKIPMLFLQGTKDEFAELDLLKPVDEVAGQAREASPCRSTPTTPSTPPPRPAARTPEVLADILDAAHDWMLQTGLGPHAVAARSRLQRRDRHGARSPPPAGAYRADR